MATLKQIDPSRTAGIRRAYAASLIKRLSALDKAIRISIVANNALGFVPDRLKLNVPTVPPAGRFEWAAVDHATALRNFNRWLTNAVTTAVLEEGSTGATIPSWLQTFVRAAYSKGVTTAMAVLKKTPGLDLRGQAAAQQSINAILSIPFHKERIEALFERNFTELKGMTQTMSTKLQRSLADGLSAGENPKAIARDISKAIDISKRRATLIARTETIRTNAEAQLNTFDRFGIADVQVEAEWLTAGDDRVCPQCEDMEGQVMSIEEARGMIPLHPDCRCGWIPLTEAP